MILYKICLPLNPMRIGILMGCIAGITEASLLLPELFGIHSMSNRCVMLLLVFSIATEPVLRYLTRLNEIIQGLYKKYQEHHRKKYAMLKK